MSDQSKGDGPVHTQPLFTTDLLTPRKQGVLLAVNQICKKTGISPYVLQKMEDKGLIRARSRTKGGHRRYHEDQIPDIRRAYERYRRTQHPPKAHVKRAAKKVPIQVERELYDQLKARLVNSGENISINSFVNRVLQNFLSQDQVKIEALIDQESLNAFLKQGQSLSHTLNAIGKQLAIKQKELEDEEEDDED